MTLRWRPSPVSPAAALKIRGMTRKRPWATDGLRRATPRQKTSFKPVDGRFRARSAPVATLSGMRPPSPDLCRRLVLLAAPLAASAADYYVAPTGSDSAAGTMAAPFATVGRGQKAASAGDTVFIRGGVYMFSGTSATVGVAFTKSGTPDQRINYFAYPGETPIFDLFNLTPQARVTGLRRALRAGSTSAGSRCAACSRSSSATRGACACAAATTSSKQLERPPRRGARDLHRQRRQQPDPQLRLAPQLRPAGGRRQRRRLRLPLDRRQQRHARAAAATSNSDDGYDFINAPGTCIVESSWAFSNGYIPDTTTAAGNGAGFKAGGFGLDTEHVPVDDPAPRRAPVRGVRQPLAGLLRQPPPGRHRLPEQHRVPQLGQLQHAGRRRRVEPPAAQQHRDVAGTAINNLTGGTDTFNSWTCRSTVSVGGRLR